MRSSICGRSAIAGRILWTEEAARLAEGQVRQAQVAREGFERGRETLAHVAYLEQQAQRDRRIVWAIGGGAALIGAILGTMLFLEVNRHAPDGWGSAGWAAWLIQGTCCKPAIS